MKNIQIENKTIGKNQPTYFIADVAANHDGDLERAKKLIYLCADAGADAAKFQHFTADTIVSDTGFKSLGGQQSHQSKWNKSVFNVYQNASINQDWTPILKETCDKAGITFLTSPYSYEIVDKVDAFLSAYKIGSGDITWLGIIDHIASKGKPVLIASGASTQDEVDIARLAHTTLVIEAPGLGDDIQAIKAGIMEIADILVVNKADRPGVENTERALRNNLQLAHPVKKNFQHHGQSMEIESTKISNESIWVPPILRTVATEGIGLPELLEKIAEHREYLVDTGDIGLRERARLTAEFDQRLEDLLLYNLLENLEDGVYENVISDLLNRRLSPSLAAKSLIEKGAK